MPAIPLVENTFFDNCRFWGSLLYRPYRRGDVWAMKTGIVSADLNMAWSEKPLLSGDRRASASPGFLRPDGLPFWWWVFPGAAARGPPRSLAKKALFRWRAFRQCLRISTPPAPEAGSRLFASFVSKTSGKGSSGMRFLLPVFISRPARASFHRFVEAMP
jgi:hypothetical protein